MNPVIAELDLGITANELAESVTASSPLNTTLITITVDDPDPVLAADIANALAASLTSAVESDRDAERQRRRAPSASPA